MQTLTLDMADDMHRTLKAMSRETETPMAEIVRSAVRAKEARPK